MTVLDHLRDHRRDAEQRADRAAARIMGHVARGGSYDDAIIKRHRDDLAAAAGDLAVIKWVERTLTEDEAP